MDGAWETTRPVAVVGTDTGLRSRLRSAIEAEPSLAPVTVVDSVETADPRMRPPHLALLDATELDEALTVAWLARCDLVWPGTQIVVIAREPTPTLVRSVLDAGALSIVLEDVGTDQLRATVGAALEGRGLLDVGLVRPVIDVYAAVMTESRKRDRAVIESLAAAVEAKDTVTSRHLRQVSHLAMQLAHHVDPQLARSDDFLYGCLLHDVGKIGVPEEILSKPGPLSPEEWVVMRRHPLTGAKVVRPLGLSPVVVDMVLYHHERWDGGGYPEGLSEDQIPLVARIFSVCDALEAMMATRPYRAAVSPQVAFERVLVEAGAQFDPVVVEVLERGVRAGAIDLARMADPATLPGGKRFERDRVVGFDP